jgi:clan AA aspartic protease (TIGR02281 family)
LREWRPGLFGCAVIICVPIIVTDCSYNGMEPGPAALVTPTYVASDTAYQFTPPTPERQARIDVFCSERPTDFASCERFFLQHPDSELKVDGSRERPTSQTSAKQTEVPLKGATGTYYVPVTINGAVQIKFVLDTGATNVSIPADVVLTLIRMGTITNSDFLGNQTYRLADGSTFPSPTFRIRSLQVGGKVLENVTASAAPVSADPLLGQSFLTRFRSWSIDNQRMVLLLE